MSLGYQVEVHVYRDSLNSPWGFRLAGGKDFNAPLIVQRVRFLFLFCFVFVSVVADAVTYWNFFVQKKQASFLANDDAKNNCDNKKKKLKNENKHPEKKKSAINSAVA